MAKKFYETDEFKKLNQKWNKKLEKVGFNDIDPGDSASVQPEVFTLPGRKTQYEHGSAGYYQMCHIILEKHEFRTAVHKKIFEHHTNGKPDRAIVDLIKDEFGRTLSQKGISKFIKDTKDIFIYGKKQ